MKYKAGNTFPESTVTTSKGTPVKIPVAGANYTHIQFRRFSGCPICNAHIAELRRSKAQLDAAGIHEVLFFHSSQEDVAAFHNDLPFDLVGDREKYYYRHFGVETSWKFASPSAIRASLASMVRGDFGLKKITDGPLGLPAEFLVAPDGRIKAAHYGKHAYDQWPVETLLDLARDSRSVVSDSAQAINRSTK
ncbi:MAG TPA: peroxiredoxin-like family protein [Candidatus Sulfotelmatobacter sp.]|nr:peroxiredoxin-like family protein [Candidatus Sulfotelmatobacter sp.]